MRETLRCDTTSGCLKISWHKCIFHVENLNHRRLPPHQVYWSLGLPLGKGCTSSLCSWGNPVDVCGLWRSVEPILTNSMVLQHRAPPVFLCLMPGHNIIGLCAVLAERKPQTPESDGSWNEHDIWPIILLYHKISYIYIYHIYIVYLYIIKSASNEQIMTFPATVSSVSSSRCQAHGLSLPIGLPSPGCAGCPGRRRGSGWGATSATRATSSICQWDSWRLPDMENVQETRHAIGVTSILSDFMFFWLIFFSSTSALFVPIQRAFSTGFQYLFPCHTSTFSAKSGAMAAALAGEWTSSVVFRSRIFRMLSSGRCSNCLKSFLSVSGCDSPYALYTMVIWARCQLLRKLAGCFESWRPLQRKWCDKLGYRCYWCTEGQCWILNNLEFMCCFTETSSNLCVLFFPRNECPHGYDQIFSMSASYISRRQHASLCPWSRDQVEQSVPHCGMHGSQHFPTWSSHEFTRRTL